MSKYTTEVRYICETKSGLTPEELINADITEIVQGAMPHIFDSTLMIGSADYTAHIEEQILLHYYTREIGEETFGLWKLRLNQKLRENAEYFSTLYAVIQKQAELSINPFIDVNYTETKDEEGEGQRTGNNSTQSADQAAWSENDANTRDGARQDTNSSTGYNLHSDTPEGSVEGINAVLEGLEGSGFLSDATKNTDSSSFGSQTHDVTEDHKNGANSRNYSDNKEFEENASDTRNTEIRVQGKRNSESFARILRDFKESIFNLDMEIIESLSQLFMLIW